MAKSLTSTQAGYRSSGEYSHYDSSMNLLHQMYSTWMKAETGRYCDSLESRENYESLESQKMFSNVYCTQCTTCENLKTFHDLKLGDHISMPDQFVNLTISGVNIEEHHSQEAIVKNIEITDKAAKKAILTLITNNKKPQNYYDENDKRPWSRVYEIIVEKDLNKDLVCLIEFKERCMDKSARLKEAEEQIGRTCYNLVGTPCEHFNSFQQNYSMTSENNQFTEQPCDIKTPEGTKKSIFISRSKVSEVGDIKRSDILGFKYYGLDHKGIVTEVVSGGQNKICIKVIHYGLPNGLFSSREILEEWIDIDLTNQTIFINKYNPTYCFPDDDVVATARKYLGEKKFNPFTNRSKHFAERCKLIPNSLIGCKKIKSYSEVKVTDIVSFKFYGLNHKGLVLEVAEDKINVLHFGCPNGVVSHVRQVMTEWIDKDPLKNDISIYTYHPSQCYPKEAVLTRANDLIGNKNFNPLTKRSRHIVESCKLRFSLDIPT